MNLDDLEQKLNSFSEDLKNDNIKEDYWKSFKTKT